MNKAVFLDRDGTIIKDYGYLADPEGAELLPGAAEAMRRLRAAGYLLVIVTNQSGIGRGYYTEADLHRVHARVVELLAAEGVTLDGHYYCVHAPEENCDCRKPSGRMLREAAADLDIDLGASAMVGDKPSDAEAGRAAGCRWDFLLRPGPDEAYTTVPDLAAAADRILGA